MKKPARELMDAFFTWFRDNPHSAQEDHYAGTLTQENLYQMDREQFIEFFYQLARDGGHVQSGGHRNASRFRATVAEKYDEFRAFVLEPFTRLFNEIEWLPRIKGFPHFGVGLATIFLNRVDKKRFVIINNRAVEAVELLSVASGGVKMHQNRRDKNVWVF
jgi:hypothetical protein